jgi:hypothetical protein
MRHLFFILLLATTALTACRKELDTVPEHLDFVFPDEEGLVRIYAARDTNFASSNTLGREGRTYFVKEENGIIETDLLGRDLTTLWTYESNDSTDTTGTQIYNWTFKELWSIYKDELYAERTEGTTRYLVMKQPPVEGTQWNGNLYNSLGASTYEVTNHDTTVTVQGVAYPHCVFVLKVPFSVTEVVNSVFYHREYAYEIYAPDIGMIVRHDEDVEVQGDAWTNYRPESESVYLHMELVAHN